MTEELASKLAWARDLIRRAFPRVREPWTYLGEGWTSLALADATGNAWRVAKSPLYNESLQRGWQKLTRLHAAIGDPLPAPVGYEEVNGYGVFGATRCAGAVLEAAQYTPQHCAAVGAFLQRLHAVPPSTLDPQPPWIASLGKKIELAERILIPQLPPVLGRALRRELALVRRVVLANPVADRCLHGDLHVGQFLFSGDRLTGVVDFDGAHLGDPAWDFRGLLEELGEDLTRTMLRNYPTDGSWWTRLVIYRRLGPAAELLDANQQHLQAIERGLIATEGAPLSGERDQHMLWPDTLRRLSASLGS